MYFEDFEAGQRFVTGTRHLDEAAILAFAREWDAQPFHIDETAARASHFGGLVASGFHTLLTAFNLTLEAGIWADASMGSPGLEAIRWLRPVRPGDTLGVRVDVAAAVPSRSRPDRGVVTLDHSVTNQAGEEVMTFRSLVILKRRDPGGPVG